MAASYDPRAIESRWSAAWERAGCYRAPELPQGPKFYNYDSGPFPSGPLHLGHVRCYLLGDVTARYQRSLGKCVLYATNWDAFGTPNELAAIREGRTPAEFTQHWIDTMGEQLRTLGISYDRSRLRSSCEPEYYRWTQWLFLRLRELGWIVRREAEVPFCPRCETALSSMQLEHGRCWRCAAPAETRRRKQWFVTIADRAPTLLRSLDRLEGWSAQVRKLVRGQVQSARGRVATDRDWSISRQRSWGTPIPIVFCASCGEVPVPEPALPVRLPDDLDWTLGSRALSSHAGFVAVDCPACDGPARRETDTLDCFFDDLWCFMGGLVDLEGTPTLQGDRLQAWMPVDRFHSGFDTVAYLHLYRFLTGVLHEAGELGFAEPVLGHVGHEMVLAEGRKMSKHLGNAISPAAIVRRHGADTLRVAMLWAATPHKAIDWREELLDRGGALLAQVHRLYLRVLESAVRPEPDGTPSRAARSLRRKTDSLLVAIGRFVDEYRPHAAIERLAKLFDLVERFTATRLDDRRLSPADRAVVDEVLGGACVALSLFAPHLAEELWHGMGNRTLVVTELWPTSSPAGSAATVGGASGGE